MCLNPVKISDVGVVACRECWQCRETKVDDWVGRNIAESKTAKAAHVVTLTYGNDETTGDIDHIRASVLTYSDVQKYLKYLRADGFPVRYFVVGEYGSLKGRAHWHIILYWQENVPDHVLRENFSQKHWPHGWSYWDKSTPEAVRYACKYLLKDASDDAKQGWGPMVSKKPPLGHQYFQELALQYVEQGLSPQSLFYSFPDVRRVPRGMKASTLKQFKATYKPVQFHMAGKTAENFLQRFIDLWEERFNDLPPRSDVVWDFMDGKLDLNGPSRERMEGETTEQYLDSAFRFPFIRKERGFAPLQPPFEGAVVQFCEKANCYFTDTAPQRLWFSTDWEGDVGWHVKIRPKKHHHIIIETIWRNAGFQPHLLEALD